MNAHRCSWAVLPLRLMLGVGMMIHGFPKLFSPGGHDQFEQSLVGIGVPAPGIAAWLVGGLELFGGALVILGALTRLLSALFIVEMLVAASTVHLPNGFNTINITGMGPDGPIFGMPGYELNLLYIAGFAALLISGAGQYSVDAALHRSTTKLTAKTVGEPPMPGWRKRRAPSWRRVKPRSPESKPPLT
jgi:putative oxidoreductase